MASKYERHVDTRSFFEKMGAFERVSIPAKYLDHSILFIYCLAKGSRV